jgi:hypothetical protein
MNGSSRWSSMATNWEKWLPRHRSEDDFKAVILAGKSARSNGPEISPRPVSARYPS